MINQSAPPYSTKHQTNKPIARVSKVRGIYIGQISLGHNEVAEVNGVFLDGNSFQCKDQPTIKIFSRVTETVAWNNKEKNTTATPEEFNLLTIDERKGFERVIGTSYVPVQEVIPQILSKIETRLPEFISSMQSIDSDLLNPAVYYNPRSVWIKTVSSLLSAAGAVDEESKILQRKLFLPIRFFLTTLTRFRFILLIFGAKKEFILETFLLVRGSNRVSWMK